MTGLSCRCWSAKHILQWVLRGAQGGGVASGGLRELIPTVARTAVACGVDGIFMEVVLLDRGACSIHGMLCSTWL